VYLLFAIWLSDCQDRPLRVAYLSRLTLSKLVGSEAWQMRTLYFLLFGCLCWISPSSADSQSTAFSIGLSAFKEGQYSVAAVLWAPLAAQGNEHAKVALEQTRQRRKSAPLKYQEIHAVTENRIAALRRASGEKMNMNLLDATYLANESQKAYQAGDKAKALGLATSALWSTVLAEGEEKGAKIEKALDEQQLEDQKLNKLGSGKNKSDLLIKEFHRQGSDPELKEKNNLE
jgi:hypothetical protein